MSHFSHTNSRKMRFCLWISEQIKDDSRSGKYWKTSHSPFKLGSGFRPDMRKNTTPLGKLFISFRNESFSFESYLIIKDSGFLFKHSQIYRHDVYGETKPVPRGLNVVQAQIVLRQNPIRVNDTWIVLKSLNRLSLTHGIVLVLSDNISLLLARYLLHLKQVVMMKHVWIS